MRLQVRELGDEVHIEVTGVAGRQERVLQALTECQRGLCAVPHGEALPSGDVSVRAGSNEMRIRLKGRSGLHYEALSIYRCLRRALVEQPALPAAVVAG